MLIFKRKIKIGAVIRNEHKFYELVMDGKAIQDGEGKGYENTEEYTSLAMNCMEDILYRKKKKTNMEEEDKEAAV